MPDASPGRFRPPFKTGLAIHAAKTALAALAALLVVQTLRLEQGYWAVITAVIVMQANLGGSLRACWSRLLGTAVGAALGAAFVLWLGGGPAALFLSVFLTILICSLTPFLKDAARVAGVTAVILTVMVKPGEHPALVGLTRFTEIGVGIVVALAVSLLVLPRRSKTVLRQGLAKMLAAACDLYQEIFDSRLRGDFKDREIFHQKDVLTRLLARNQALLQEARSESLDEKGLAALGSILRNLDRMFEHLLTMEHVIEGMGPAGIHEHMLPELEALKARTLEAMTATAAFLSEAAACPFFGPLDEAVGAARRRLAELRQAGTPRSYDLAEVMRFFSFVQAMFSLAYEVRETAARARELG